MLEEIYDIIDTILEYLSDLDMGVDISDNNKSLIKYLTYIFKVMFALYILYSTIPKMRTYGVKYQSTTNGALKLLKATVKLIFGISMIYFMLFPRDDNKCPPCPECPIPSDPTTENESDV